MEVFYKHFEKVHNLNAPKQILPFLIESFQPNSVLDVGCGIGTWLKVAKDLGVKEVVGVDGNNVDRQLLKIEESEFIVRDLRIPFDLNKKYDLVFCLEVVEHLPESLSNEIVSTLCKHGDIIIFSAAIPNQGGQNHINEKWPQYWESIFALNGLKAYDILRPKFWNNDLIDFWYRQNIIIFAKKDLSFLIEKTDYNHYYPYIHPELFLKLLDEMSFQKENFNQYKKDPGIKDSLKMLLRSALSNFKNIFNSK